MLLFSQSRLFSVV